MKTIEIKNYLTNETIHCFDVDENNNTNISKNKLIKFVVHEAVIKKISLQYAELINCCLKCVNLYEADLKGSDLRNSDLQGSDLTKSDLREAFLINTDFTDSILDGVKVDKHTRINKHTYYTIPDKYKHIFDVCTFID